MKGYFGHDYNALLIDKSPNIGTWLDPVQQVCDERFLEFLPEASGVPLILNLLKHI
jgi:hypothetical protein